MYIYLETIFVFLPITFFSLILMDFCRLIDDKQISKEELSFAKRFVYHNKILSSILLTLSPIGIFIFETKFFFFLLILSFIHIACLTLSIIKIKDSMV